MNAWFSDKIEKFGIWIVLIVGLMTLLPGTVDMPLLDRDEPRFSQATAEMMDRQDWVVPYFNGDYRFDKPPLTYWWMRTHYWIFGKSEIGARLHSVWSSLILAAGLFLMSRKYFGTQVAFFASIAWLSIFQIFQHGRLALADMPMITAVFYACWGFYELTKNPDEKPSKKWFWLLYISLGLGFLAKGPIALATPIVAALFYRFAFWRKPLNWKYLRPISGSFLVLAMVGAWGIPALIVTDGLFWDIGMGKHVIERGTEAFNERKVIPAYYFVTAFISLFPWIALLGKRLRHIRKGWDQTTAYLLSWIVSPYLIFLFYSTQLPHYVMPAFPALLIWMMVAFCNKDWKWGKLGNIWFWTYVGLFEILLMAGLVWLLGSHLDPSLSGVKYAMAAVFVLLLSLNGIVVALRYHSYLLAAPFLLLVVISQVFLGMQMRSVSPVIPIARIIEGLPQGTRLVGVGFEEPSLVFYTGRVWDFDVDKEALLADLKSESGRKSCYVVLQHEQIIDQLVNEGWGGPVAEFRKELGLDLRANANQTHVVRTIRGLNFARMRWSEIIVLFPMDPLPASSSDEHL